MAHASLAGVDAAGGALIAAHQNFVRCDGHLVIVLTDPVAPHGPPQIHDDAVVVRSSMTVRINGIGIARAGDAASCGHACSGSSHIDIGS